jgi:hypothetical protein
MWCPIIYEPHHESQIRLHFHLCWMTLIMDDMTTFFIFLFIQTNSSHKLWLHMQLETNLQSNMQLQVIFTRVSWRIITSQVAKMVNMDTNRKYMVWYGHDSL